MRHFLSVYICAATFQVPLINAHQLETVFVQGRQTNLIGSASSASEGLVSQHEIALRPLLRTGEVLELVPGMVATQHSGNGKANQYFLRGFNLDHGSDFATHVDGIPVNMRTHGHGQGYTDLNFVIPELISDLAYKKGAYYAEVGDFSGAGSAHIRTAKRLNSSFIDFSVGKYGHRRLVVGDSHELANGDLLLGLERHTYDGPWSDVNEDLRKTNFLLSYTDTLSGGEFSVTGKHYQNRWHSADQIPERAMIQGGLDSLGSLDPTLGGESRRSSISTTWQGGRLKASAYYVRSRLNLWSNFTYFLEDPVNGDQFEQVDARDTFGAELGFEQHGVWKVFPTKSVKVRTKFGLGVQVDDIDEVGLYNTHARQRFGVVRADAVKERSIGAFVENEIEWSPRLRSVFGARYDHYNFDVQDLVGVNTRGIDLSANSGVRTADLMSLKASLSYAFDESWEAYASLGQGFHSNDARGTTVVIDPASGERIDTVNPLVRSFAYEIGARGFVTERINTSLSFWALDLDSELVFVGDAGNTEASGASERYGIELASYYQLHKNWTLDLELALSDAKFSDAAPNEDHIPGAINQVVQAGVSGNLNNGWSGSLRLRHFGERPLSEDGRIRSDGSTLWNLRVAYETRKATFSIDVLNLANSADHDIDYFYESRLPFEPEAGVADIHSRRLEPRNVRLSFRYTL